MPRAAAPPLRIVVIGSSCAGKSTLARALADARGCAFVELDELFWSPAWTPKPEAEFLRLVDEASAGGAWIAAGNYGAARDLLWNRATTIVWLDLRLARVFSRGLRRTFARITSAEPLFHGNRESLRRSLFSRESILWWILTTFQRRRREFAELQSSGRYGHLAWHRARTPAQVRDILALLSSR